MEGGAVGHEVSSAPSSQSLLPSHKKFWGIHLPFGHMYSSARQGLAAVLGMKEFLFV